ncbi:MAG: hypothetical protein ACTHU0_39740 [Kofleriaceae bacterium]
MGWTELHDATLESLELRWSSGDVVMRVRTSDPTHPRRVVLASAVRRVRCDREMPWGFSASINEVRGPMAAGDDVSVLEIEMQSGDLIRIEAGAFRLEDLE